MMSKCVKCGTAWTSMGLPICPICGTPVPKSPEVSESGRHARVPAPGPQIAEPPEPVLSAAFSPPGPFAPPDKSTSSICPERPDKPNRSICPVPRVLKEPTPPPPAAKIDHAATALSDFGFDQITIPEPDNSKESICPAEPDQLKRSDCPVPVPVPVPSGEEDSWYCSLPAIEPAPPPPKPVVRKHLPVRPALEPPPATSAITELVDASVLVDRVRPKPAVAKRLPAPARPLTIPLILGIFAALAGVAPPVAAGLSNNRFGVLGFCVSGLLLPLAPLAWMAGLAAEQRRREQGLRVERRVLIGRLLGQWGTLLLAAEGTIALLLIAAVRLAGR